MNKFVYIILSFYIINVNAQQNLVLNPSFEDFNGDLNCSYYLQSNDVPLVNWLPANTSPFNILSSTLPVDCEMHPLWMYANQPPRTGNNYVSLQTTYIYAEEKRNHIRGFLSQPLEVGVTYNVEFYVCLANLSNYAMNNLGVVFVETTQPTIQNPFPIILQPHLNYSGTPISDKDNWTLLSFQFTPTVPNLGSFIIGNFFETEDTEFLYLDNPVGVQATYLIDDVAIYVPKLEFDLPEEICEGDSLVFPDTSENGVTGVWSPAPNNQQTTTYTFFPDNINYPPRELTIVVIPKSIPEFDQIGPFCYIDTEIISLPSVSKNGISGSWSPEFDPYNSQTYTFTPDAGECSEGFSMFVEVHPQLKFDVQSFCKSGLIYAEVIPSNFSLSDISSYQWIINQSLVPESGNQIILSKYSHLLGEVNSIEVNIMDVNGCLHSKEILIDENFLCKIQKGISPNGDGLNDYLDLVSFGGVDLKIFNRYGIVVYEKVNYINEWKGQSESKEQLSSGTYFYFFKTNVGEEFSGYIQLMY